MIEDQATELHKMDLRAELENTRKDFHALVAETSAFAWLVPSRNPEWTAGEVFGHMVMAVEMIPPEVAMLRRGLRWPAPPAWLFDALNPAVTRLLARRFTLETIGSAYDRAHARMLSALDEVGPADWEKGTEYPDVDPPLISGHTTVLDLFHYARQHFEEHAADVRFALARRAPPVLNPLEEQQTGGLMQYPREGWRKWMFKAPIQLWRLGLGPVVGHLILLATHTGRKSGLPRRTMLEYYTLNGRKYVVAAFGEKAQWYLNLKADPRVTLQTAHGVENARAVRVIDDLELLAILETFRRHDPPLTRWYLESNGIAPDDPDDLLSKKNRLHILRFEPTAEQTPPPLPADLTWIWPVAGAVVSFTALLLYRRKRRRR